MPNINKAMGKNLLCRGKRGWKVQRKGTYVSKEILAIPIFSTHKIPDTVSSIRVEESLPEATNTRKG